jgi:hypothetical protein
MRDRKDGTYDLFKQGGSVSESDEHWLAELEQRLAIGVELQRTEMSSRECVQHHIRKMMTRISSRRATATS